MSKTIEEVHRRIFDKDSKDSIDITARNFKSHLIQFSSTLWETTPYQLRKIAQFLTETADKIDNDPDFNQNAKK